MTGSGPAPMCAQARCSGLWRSNHAHFAALFVHKPPLTLLGISVGAVGRERSQ